MSSIECKIAMRHSLLNFFFFCLKLYVKSGHGRVAGVLCYMSSGSCLPGG